MQLAIPSFSCVRPFCRPRRGAWTTRHMPGSACSIVTQESAIDTGANIRNCVHAHKHTHTQTCTRTQTTGHPLSLLVPKSKDQNMAGLEYVALHIVRAAHLESHGEGVVWEPDCEGRVAQPRVLGVVVSWELGIAERHSLRWARSCGHVAMNRGVEGG